MKKLISIKEMRKICQKNSYDSWCSKKILNKFSIYFTWIFSLTPITPNQVTFLMILSGVIGGIFLALNGYLNDLIGVLFLYLFLVLDLTDGELARYKKVFSKKGKFLDFIANDIIFIFMFLGLSFKIFNNNYKMFGHLLFHNPIVLILGLSVIIFFLLFKLSSYYAKEIDEDFCRSFSKFNRFNKKIKSIILKISDNIFYDTIVIMVVIIGIIFNVSQYILLFYGISFMLRYFIAIFLKLNSRRVN